MRRNLWSWGLLGLLAVLLLNSCRVAIEPPPTPPPPTWGPLPTRYPTPTPTSPAGGLLDQMRLSLLRGESEAAAFAWEQARAVSPDNPTVLREGARLALLNGELELAAERAWEAVTQQPDDSLAWVILSLILQAQGEPLLAQQTLAVAQSLDPQLQETLFNTRWQMARQAGDVATLELLARSYTLAHPGDPLALYYRAEALLALDQVETALELLLMRMQDGDAPAVLWYTLGRAYLRLGATEEAAISLEVAQDLVAQGDLSLTLASDAPASALSLALGEAYLAARRCAEAEPLLRQLTTPYPHLGPLVEAAIICQTPTPTWTPWIPSQQATPIP